LDGSALFYVLAAQSPGDPDVSDPTRDDGVKRVEWGLSRQADGTNALRPSVTIVRSQARCDRFEPTYN
jgi:hypothetical protein